MTVGILLLAQFQDVISGGARQSIEVLFSPAGNSSTFSSACALTTSLDGAGWNLFLTAIFPGFLSSTARYISQTDDAVLGFGEVSTAASALTLVARLAWSGRVREAFSAGVTGIKAWEQSVGKVCEKRLRDWTADYKLSKMDEESVRSYSPSTPRT
jgi:hypothetical protein